MFNSGTKKRGWLAPETLRNETSLLYVANYDSNSVTIYDASAKSSIPLGSITEGLSEPFQCAVDRHENLFVTNFFNSTVAAYKRGSTVPFRIYSHGLDSPFGLAVGPDDTLYILDLYDAKIVVYPPGKINPSKTLLVPNDKFSDALAIDTHNNIYVTFIDENLTPQVDEFLSGSKKARNLGLVFNQPYGTATGIAVDAHHNLLLAYYYGYDPSLSDIEIFPNGSATPSRSISTPGEPWQLAFSRDQAFLYVGSGASPASVLEIRYRSARTIYSFVSGNLMTGVAISPKAP